LKDAGLQGTEKRVLELGSFNSYRVMKALAENRSTIFISNI